MARILIVGAGAVGSYYGALLARAGHEVTLVDGGPHADAVAARGAVAVREPDGTEWTAPVAVAERPEGRAPALAVIATAPRATARAARALAPVLAAATPVLSLQPGVECVGRAAGVLGPERLLAGVSTAVLDVAAPGTVRLEAAGRVAIGEPEGGVSARARRVHRLLAACTEADLAEDVGREQWRELLRDVGFSAVSAVTGCTAREALATPESEGLVRQAMAELVAVARRSGVELSSADADAAVAAGRAGAGAGAGPGRDTPAAFVVREGARLDVSTPVNRVLDALLALQADRASGARRHTPTREDR